LFIDRLKYSGTAFCISLSPMVGIPKERYLPFPLGMFTLLTSFARYRFSFRLVTNPWILVGRFASNSLLYIFEAYLLLRLSYCSDISKNPEDSLHLVADRDYGIDASYSVLPSLLFPAGKFSFITPVLLARLMFPL